MLRSHKIALDPNNRQAAYFSGSCGVARFAYNWGLTEWKRQYEAGIQRQSYLCVGLSKFGGTAMRTYQKR
ncbi:helix-turn-helix domain-containing protein [Alicyclobacillus sp. ALC3]|uniref:helix-turn-helix domain-containing protein n=1 Tax=Alicyclobacillus sp. ALC3 TaxID=2796143 RepID=UPI00279C6A47|nr:helix-turn-helix domain-containing protein [Alicyclobacillus sp. ALC3]